MIIYNKAGQKLPNHQVNSNFHLQCTKSMVIHFYIAKNDNTGLDIDQQEQARLSPLPHSSAILIFYLTTLLLVYY